MSELNPHNTIAIFKDKTGKELGRCAVTASNYKQFMENMVQRTGSGGTIDFIEDEDEAAASRLVSGMFNPRLR